MAEITEQQAEFVAYYVANGGNAAQAARDAGYAEEHARVSACKLLKKSHVQEAVQEEKRRLISGKLSCKALAVLEAVLDDKDAPVGAKVDAAKTILDRGGNPATREPATKEPLYNKPLNEMSVSELEAFIRDGQSKIQQLQAQRAGSASGGPTH